MKHPLRLLAFLTGLVAPILTNAQALEAHVHGKALLQIAVDQQTLTLYFSSPLDNLLGFEHQPRTQAQVNQVNAMMQQFYQNKLFTPTKAAQCTLQHVDLDSLVIQQQHTEHHKHQEAHDHETHEGHADLDAEVIYACKQAKNLHDLTVQIFSTFPNLHAVDVEIVSDRGQSAQQLTPKNNHVIW